MYSWLGSGYLTAVRYTRRTKGFIGASEIQPPSVGGERWVRLEQSPLVPDWVTDLQFGFARPGDVWECHSVTIRSDQPISPRRMREVPLASLQAQALDAAQMLLSMKPRVTAEPGAGRGGHPDAFLRQVYELYRYACEHEPRRPVTWMHEQGLPPTKRPESVKTVSAWVRQAKRLEEGRP